MSRKMTFLEELQNHLPEHKENWKKRNHEMAEQGLQVVVKFPTGISLDIQGPFLLNAEKALRASTGLDVRVVKDLKGDDSKLRVMMTPAMRDKL